MQVIQPAIGDFGVNTGDLELCLLPVLAAEFLLGKAALVFGKLGGVFSRMAGIAGLEAITGDEQIFNTYIDANRLRGDRQQRRLKFAQAGHEVSACCVFGNGNGGWIARQWPAPLDVKRIFALGKRQLPVFVTESAIGKLGTLFVFFRFKHRVFCPALKEVFECGLLVSQALLQRNTRNFIEKSKLRSFFNLGQFGIGANVTDLLLDLIVRIHSVTKDVVVNKAHTAKRLGKQFCLLGVWIESILVCAFNFHGSHFTLDYVITSTQKDSNPKEEARTGSTHIDALSFPGLNAGVSRAKKMMTVKVVKDEVSKLLNKFKELNKKEVLVGVPQNKTNRKSNELNNAQIAFINNYGSPANNIPPRPFMEPGINKIKGEYFSILKKYALSLPSDNSSLEKGLNAIGLVAQSSIKNIIRTNEGFPPIKDSTLKQRRYQNFKGEKALIRTGQLLNSITYVIRDKK